MLSKAFSRRSRAFSTTASSLSDHSASSIASAFLSRFQSRGPQTRHQLLDANQLQLLSLTLNRPSLYPSSSSSSSSLSNNAASPDIGTPIPPGHHLVYFTPAFLESELGADGTDTSYNPSAPFTRRMWAGGEVRWPRDNNGKPNLLRIGQTVSETTRVLSAEAKVVRRTGEEMIVVGVEKTLENEDGVAVVDRRNWVFRPALEELPAPRTMIQSPQPKQKPPRESIDCSTDTKDGHNVHRTSFKRTPITLFRFSALTFNPHRIHYDQPWARDVEGHKNIVVHGPLNLISILDFWRDVKYQKSTKDSELAVPQSISYRATSPLYADEEYEMVLTGGQAEIFDQDGVLAMTAEIIE